MVLDSCKHGMPSTRPAKPVGKSSAKFCHSGGWQRVAGLAVVGTVGTVLGIVTGSPEAAVGVIVPLLPFLPR